MVNKNQVISLKITGMTAEGSGVGRHDGMAVFVPQTAIGDTAEVRIVKLLKSYAFGIVQRIEEPSADRTDADCAVFSQCGGCVFRHISYQAELRIKDGFVRDAFTRIGGLSAEFEPILGCEDITEYRNKAQYPVGKTNGEAVCGFYASRSHRIVPSSGCALQPALFSQIVSDIMTYVRDKNIKPYDEKTGKGLLRHIYLRRGAHSGQVQVCLVITKTSEAVFAELTNTLSQKYNSIKSIVLNINDKKTNVILGQKCVTLYGSDTIADTMCGIELSLSPLSFYQVNTVQAEKLYGIAGEYAKLSGKETLLDLYCGIGTIGLSLASQAKEIIGVESVKQAVLNARENAKRNGITNARFIHADATQAAQQLLQEGVSPDVVVLDPPRKGCDKSALDAVASMSPSRIVMVSCNPATAARDCAILDAAGYSTVRARAVDLFPRTGHVETVVLMSRVKE